jgi:hypothetical protein
MYLMLNLMTIAIDNARQNHVIVGNERHFSTVVNCSLKKVKEWAVTLIVS